MRELTADHFSDESSPVFPLSDSGEVWYTGWDIPGYWAIDAKGNAFADFGAHGICLSPTTVDMIIREVESAGGNYVDGLRLRKLIGRKPPLPGWVWDAENAGWTPPATFDRNEYE